MGTIARVVRTSIPLFLLAGCLEAQGILYSWPVPAGNNSVASAGDVDGDGTPDFAVGEPGAWADTGRVRVWSGRTGAAILAVDGMSPGDAFGHRVAGLGDVDGDGFGDVAASAPQPGSGGARSYVRAISGASGAALWQVSSPSTRIAFGTSLAVMGDLDLDGVRELVVGAVGFPQGRALVLSGATGSTLLEISGLPGAAYDYGTAVGPAGDLDLDGVPDFLVGDPQHVPGGPGRVTVHSGADGSVLLSLDGPAPGSSFGSTLASVGDANGDGIPDVLVGSPQELIAVGLSWGRARLFSGADGSTLQLLEGGLNLTSYGMSVAAFQDLDGDNRRDLLIGAGAYKVGCCTYFTAEVRVHSSATGVLLYSGPEQSSPRIAVVPDANGDGLVDYLIPATYLPGGFSAALALTGQPPPTIVHTCPPKKTSQGCDPWVASEGVPSPSMGPDLTIRALNVLPHGAGMFVWSTSQGSIPFGGGTLCLARPIQRLPVQPTGGGSPPCHGSIQATGSISHTFTKADLAALGLAPGDDFLVQGLFRDPGFAPPQAVGLTGALQVTIWP